MTHEQINSWYTSREPHSRERVRAYRIHDQQNLFFPYPTRMVKIIAGDPDEQDCIYASLRSYCKFLRSLPAEVRSKIPFEDARL